MDMDRWLELITLATIQSCALILVVLAIRAPVARWLGARWAYYLWLAPLLGLAALAVSGSGLRQWIGLPGFQVPGAGWVLEQAGSVPYAVLAAWSLGFAATLSVFTARSIGFAIRLRRHSRELSFEERAVVRDRCARLARRMDVDFRLLPGAEGPAVAGFLQPVLMLPVDFFERYSVRQQTLMLAHELQHLCRRDLFARFLARFYRCLFWFNPLSWIAERYVQLDQELSCDERVLAREGAGSRKAYGEAMLLSLHAPLAPDQAGYPGPFGQIRTRAAHLPHHHRRMVGSAIGACITLAVGGAALMFGALGSVDPGRDLRQARALISEADSEHASGRYVETLKALVRAESLAPGQYTPATWALRGSALAYLRQWDQAEICYQRAIDGAEKAGQRPQERWFLMQAALRVNLDDLEGAARSLDAAARYFPETPFEERMSLFGRLAEQHWEPRLEEPLAAFD